MENRKTIKTFIAMLKKEREEKILLALFKLGDSTAKQLAQEIGLRSGQETSSNLRNLCDAGLVISKGSGYKTDYVLVYWLSLTGLNEANKLDKKGVVNG